MTSPVRAGVSFRPAVVAWRRRLPGLVLTLLLPTLAHAWGADGHRITGYVAQPLLGPVAVRELRELMGGVDVPAWSTWMDEQRDRLRTTVPGSPKWHYDNRPVCGEAPREEVCPDGDCASEQADRLMGVLSDPEAPVEARRQAVLMLVHIIGDLHQPLHAGEHGDLGGNQVRVTLVGPLFPTNLHAVWDSDLVNMTLWQGPTTTAAGVTMVRGNAQRLVRRFRPRFAAWRTGSVENWFEESRALSRQYVYAPLPGFRCDLPTQAKGAAPLALPAAYVETARSLVPGQLARAGVRIAHVLNTTLEAAVRRRQTSVARTPP